MIFMQLITTPPQEGTFDVILDSQDQAVCIVEVTRFLFSLSIKCQPTMPTRKGG
ncbi:MAG: hypothetical protein ACLT8V_06615 [Streptococcus salivarius]